MASLPEAAEDEVVSADTVTGATPPPHPQPAQIKNLSGPAFIQAYSTLHTAHTSALERIALLQFIGSSGQALTDAVLDRLVLLDGENARLAEQVREGRHAVDELRAALLALEAEKAARAGMELTLKNTMAEAAQQREDIANLKGRLEEVSKAAQERQSQDSKRPRSERNGHHRSSGKHAVREDLQDTEMEDDDKGESRSASGSSYRKRQRSRSPSRDSAPRDRTSRSEHESRSSIRDDRNRKSTESSRRSGNVHRSSRNGESSSGRRSRPNERSKEEREGERSRSTSTVPLPESSRAKDRSATHSAQKPGVPAVPKADRSSRLGRLGLPVNADGAAKRGFGILGRAAAAAAETTVSRTPT